MYAFVLPAFHVCCPVRFSRGAKLLWVAQFQMSLAARAASRELSAVLSRNADTVIVEVAWRAEYEGDGLLSCFLFIIELKRGPEVNMFTLADATSSYFTLIPCPIKIYLLS